MLLTPVPCCKTSRRPGACLQNVLALVLVVLWVQQQLGCLRVRLLLALQELQGRLGRQQAAVQQRVVLGAGILRRPQQQLWPS